jgi:hypothetical protein
LVVEDVVVLAEEVGDDVVAMSCTSVFERS